MSSSDGQPHIMRMRHTLRFVALCPVIGIVMSGIVWLVIYDSQYTPDIDINGNGPAFLGMMLALAIGWLLATLISLTLYVRGNKSRKILQAVAIVIICGLIAGLGTGYALTKYALSHYSSFCERHEKMCIESNS